MPKIYGYTEVFGDMIIMGSFSITGSASIINTTNLLVEDPILVLAHGQTGSPVLDSGFFIDRGAGATQAFIWDESDDKFALISTNNDHTTIGNVSITDYSDLKIGNLTTKTNLINSSLSAGSVKLIDAQCQGNTVFSVWDFGTVDFNSNGYGSSFNIKSSQAVLNLASVGGYLPTINFLNGPSGTNDTGTIGGSNGAMFIRYNSFGLAVANAYFTPTAALHVTGETFSSSSYALKLDDSLSNPLLYVSNSGYVSIGTASATNKLHVYATQSGAFRLQDGSEGTGKVLTSDSNGVGTWQVGITKVSATFSPGTASLPNTITHGLNTTDISVQLWDLTTNKVILSDIGNPTLTTVDITFTVNPSGVVKAIIIG